MEVHGSDPTLQEPIGGREGQDLPGKLLCICPEDTLSWASIPLAKPFLPDEAGVLADNLSAARGLSYSSTSSFLPSTLSQGPERPRRLKAPSPFLLTLPIFLHGSFLQHIAWMSTSILQDRNSGVPQI